MFFVEKSGRCGHAIGDTIENNSICEKDIHYKHAKSFGKQERNNENIV